MNQQKIIEEEIHEFSIKELNSFCLQEGGMKKLKQCFYYDNIDAFRNFCSLVVRGKEFSHPSKKRRREAYLDLFATLSGYKASKMFELQLNAEEVKATYDNITMALLGISDRWKRHPIDAIYSLCMLIDFDSNGYATWNDFFDFLEGIEDATKHKTLNTEKVLTQLYRDLRDHTKLCAYGGFYSQDLTNEVLTIDLSQDELVLYARIAEFLAYTRKLGNSPLKELYQLLQQKGAFITVNDLINFFTALGAIIKDDTTDNDSNNNNFVENNKIIKDIKLEENFDYDNVNETIELLRINANKISEKLTSRSDTTDPNILNALKSIEQELGSFGKKISNNNNNNDNNTNTNSSSKAANIWSFSESAYTDENNSPIEDNLATRRGVATPDKLTVFNNKLSPRVSFYQTPVGEGVVSKLSEGSINITPSSNSPNKSGKIHNRRMSLSAQKDTISLLHKVTKASTPSPGASARVDLSIFRSPLSRQQSGNKNMYDDKNYIWHPTIKTNKYNQRFQTKEDLINQSKLNSLLGYYNN